MAAPWQAADNAHIGNMDLDAPVFEAVIVPHRSLSPRALRRLLGAICLMCGINASIFIALGAWPVGGFTGIELLLAAFLLRLNARSARASEVVLLSGSGLRVLRTDPKGVRTDLTLPPAWLSVELSEKPGRVSRLWLVARQTREEIAATLGEDEKRDLAAALAGALHRFQNPVFDNPQLREATP